jgi:hypothetical protein
MKMTFANSGIIDVDNLIAVPVPIVDIKGGSFPRLDVVAEPPIGM